MDDVIFFEVFKEEETALKKFLPKKIRAKFVPATIQSSGIKNITAKLISIRTQSRIPELRENSFHGILTRSTGYDHLMDCRTKISCGYLGEYCARAVAEHAILMSAALLRKFKKQMINFDKFDRNHISGLECQGRRLLVVGVGNIGSEVVDVARGLRIQVKGVDIKPKLNNLDYVSLVKGIAWAEVVVCALPLTGQTVGMLNYSILKRAKPGLVFINVSRGEISPIKDLERLLKEGMLGGVGMDVFEQEAELAQCLQENKTSKVRAVKATLSLKDNENVIFTPHNAFNTLESLERKSCLSAESVQEFLKKQRFPFPVPQ